jgi:hypothetical protein
LQIGLTVTTTADRREFCDCPYLKAVIINGGTTINEGAFLCGNIVTREKKSDKNDHNYPISEVKIKSEDLVNAVTDENGYFVVFSLEDGYFQFVADYEYGYKRTLTVSIKNAPIIVPTSMSMVNGDWVKDGYINGKDFSKFLHAQQGADTSIDLKYYDINKDGIVNDDDVNIVMELLSYTQTKENNNPFNVN